MSTIDLTQYANEDRGELTVAPADEYPVMLKKFKKNDDGEVLLYTGETERPFFLLHLEIIDDPNADNYKDFTHYIGLPHGDMTGKQRKMCLNKLETVGQAFGIDFFSGELAVADIEGKASCMAILEIEESETWGEQNRVRQFLVQR